MKHILLLIAAAIGVSPLFAYSPATGRNALYVHRNDRTTDAVFFSDLDSIVYSPLDIDSVRHENMVTAEFWTPDSVIRIPVSAIDSISFQPLPTIYKPGVVRICDKLIDYVSEADSNKLILNPSIPSDLIPPVGQKLVCIDGCPRIPYGFAGEVTNVERSEKAVTLTCEILGPLDVMDQFTLSYDGTTEAQKRQSRGTYIGDEIFDKTIPLDFSMYFDVMPDEEVAFANIGASSSANIRLNAHTYKFATTGKGNDLFVSGKFITDFEMDMTSSICGKIGIEKKLPLVDVGFKIPHIYFIELYLDTELFFTAQGSFCLDMDKKLKIRTQHNFTFSNDDNIARGYTMKSTTLENETKFHRMTGNVNIETGLTGEIGVRLIKVKLLENVKAVKYDVKAYSSLSMGLGLDINLPIYKSALADGPATTALYRLIKENSTPLNLYSFCNAGFGMKALLGIYWKDKKYEGINLELKWEPVNLKYTLWESPEIFPTFDNLQFVNGSYRTYARSDISGNLVFPTHVGYKVLDDTGKEYASVQFPDFYKNPSSFYAYDLDIPAGKSFLNKKLTLYPYCTAFDIPVLADPSKEIDLKCVPVTEKASEIHSTDATLNGRIESPLPLGIINSEPDITAGFQYSSSFSNLESAGIHTASLRPDGTFSFTAQNLKKKTVYYYRAFIRIGDTTEYGETKSFETKESDEEVDLGLSVKWRAWNLGAEKANDFGNYYSWGATTPSENFSWNTYHDSPYDSSGEWVGCSAITTDITGGEHDAANINRGEGWRMPTRAEMEELIEKCTWQWSTRDGVNGYTVTGPNGNDIFLPAAGIVDGQTPDNTDTYGGYWTSTINSAGTSMAGIMYFYGETLHSLQWSNRYLGRSIRPVKD